MWQLVESVFKRTPIIMVTFLLMSKNTPSEAAPTAIRLRGPLSAIAEEKYKSPTFIQETEFSSSSKFEQDLEKSFFAQTLPNYSNKTSQNSTEILEQIRLYNNINGSQPKTNDNSMGQVNSVNQLRDVSPTDWAYQALRSLVERYGCIVGYPDRTFRGSRAISRYEFAAGLNACIQQIEGLIAQSEAILKEDLEILKKLAQEYETELAFLGSRVDNLESRVAFIEDNSFLLQPNLPDRFLPI